MTAIQGYIARRLTDIGYPDAQVRIDELYDDSGTMKVGFHCETLPLCNTLCERFVASLPTRGNSVAERLRTRRNLTAITDFWYLVREASNFQVGVVDNSSSTDGISMRVQHNLRSFELYQSDIERAISLYSRPVDVSSEMRRLEAAYRLFKHFLDWLQRDATTTQATLMRECATLCRRDVSESGVNVLWSYDTPGGFGVTVFARPFSLMQADDKLASHYQLPLEAQARGEGELFWLGVEVWYDNGDLAGPARSVEFFGSNDGLSSLTRKNCPGLASLVYKALGQARQNLNEND